MLPWASRRAACIVVALSAVSSSVLSHTANAQEAPLRCVAFSPYIAGYDPDDNRHPPPQVIDTLLDQARAATGLNCIQTYGVLHGLDYIFDAAAARGMKVIAIIWLNDLPAVNDASISKGIEVALKHPVTIARVSCGSEVRRRLGPTAAEPIIQNCLTRLRAAKVTQPLTAIDTWWEWCNRSWPCQVRPLSSEVNWIGINVFPWWEDRHSELFPCTTAADADEFHIARLQNVSLRYPGTHVVLTEFGWPAGPDGYTEPNETTGQRCGVASESNQRDVFDATLARLAALGLWGTAFGAVREPWKARPEGPVGPYWGLIGGMPRPPTNLRIVR
jgi:exo-beta-1,3-glucanase (GH17 family)